MSEIGLCSTVDTSSVNAAGSSTQGTSGFFVVLTPQARCLPQCCGDRWASMRFSSYRTRASAARSNTRRRSAYPLGGDLSSRKDVRQPVGGLPKDLSHAAEGQQTGRVKDG